MSEISDFWIGKIHVIIKKNEMPGFYFENMCRKWHGFVLITDGAGVFCTQNKKVNVKKGDVFFVNKGCRYTIEMSGGGSYITTAFDLFFAEENADRAFPCVLPCREKVMEMLEEICAMWAENKYANASRCRIVLMQACESFFSSLPTSLTEKSESDISAAVAFVRANFKRNFSSDEIAKHCNISKSYLRSKFSSEMGMSITEYREKLRMDEAQNMLESGFFSVKEVSQELGYFDVFHFTKRFTKAVGVSPARYKKSFYTKQ